MVEEKTKMKSLKKSVLLYLGLADQLAINQRSGYVAYDYLYQHLGFYSNSSVRAAVNSLEKAGLVEKFWQGRTAYFKLTVMAKEALERLWPALFANPQPWRKYFYIVILKSSTAKQRRFLLKLIRAEGFKKISRGTYMNFYPITEGLRKKLVEKGLLDKIIPVKTADFGWLKPEDLILQAWGAKTSQKIAKQIVNEADKLLKRLKIEKRLSNQSKKEFLRLNKTALTAFKHWPQLPGQFSGINSDLKNVFQALKMLSSAFSDKKSSGKS